LFVTFIIERRNDDLAIRMVIFVSLNFYYFNVVTNKENVQWGEGEDSLKYEEREYVMRRKREFFLLFYSFVSGKNKREKKRMGGNYNDKLAYWVHTIRE
jgi:hypothetical protein